MNASILYLLSLIVTTTSGAATAIAHLNSSDIFSSGRIPLLNIELEESAVAALRLHPRAYVKARLTEGGVVYEDVGLHLEGNYGTFQGIEGPMTFALSKPDSLSIGEAHGFATELFEQNAALFLELFDDGFVDGGSSGAATTINQSWK